MDTKKIRKILTKIRSGKMGVSSAMEALKVLPYEDMGFAKIDTHRDLRCAFPEVVLCRGKTLNQIKNI